MQMPGRFIDGDRTRKIVAAWPDEYGIHRYAGQRRRPDRWCTQSSALLYSDTDSFKYLSFNSEVDGNIRDPDISPKTYSSDIISPSWTVPPSFLHGDNNNIDNVYGAVIMAEPLREFSRFI